MGRCADHAIVESQTQAVGVGEMGVHHVRPRLVCLTEEGEQGVGLGGEILPSTHGEQKTVLQVRKLLQIAENGAGTLFLLFL